MTATMNVEASHRGNALEQSTPPSYKHDGRAHDTDRLIRARTELLQLGYCILPQALSSNQVCALRQRLEEQMLAERRRGLGYEYCGDTVMSDTSRQVPGDQLPFLGNRWVSMLVNKGRVFVDLLEHREVNQLLREFLGAGFLLSSYAAHITQPGVPARPLCHTDQWWLPRTHARSSPHQPAGNARRGDGVADDPGDADALISPPVVATVIWLLSDFDAANGGTRLVPGSHLRGTHPALDSMERERSVVVAGSAGTAVVFDGRIWHGAGTNHSSEARIGLFASYSAGMFRANENYTLATSPEVLANASPELLRRLGFIPWQGYGRIGENVAGPISPERDCIGELRD